MKFKDFKYIKLLDAENNDVYELNFQPFEIGFGVEFDDIDLILKIKDNILSIEFTEETNDILDGKNSIYSTPTPLKEKDDMLKMFKNALIKFPFIADEWELIYE